MTIEQPHSAKLITENNKTNPQDIGLIFAREYYTFLNRKPNRLHGFFGADSLLVRGDEGESVPMLKGQEEIRKKIEELNFDDCKVLVTQVDSQFSANEGVLVSVLGEITNKDQPSQKFSETFFLAPQPNGYYVLNNIFRFLKDKVDIDYYLCGVDEDENEEKVRNIDVTQVNGKMDKVNMDDEEKNRKVFTNNEVPEDVSSDSTVINNVHAISSVPASTTPVSTTSSIETNKPHYYKEVPNNYSIDQRGYQKTANSSWATLAASNAAKSEQIESIKSPPPQYYSHQKPEPLNQQNYTPSMHMVNNVHHTNNNYNISQQQHQLHQPRLQHPHHHHHQQQQQQYQQIQPPMQYNRPPYQNYNKDQRIKDTQIFVKNVTGTMTEEQLENAFNQFGPIKSVSIGQARNCAFIDFLSIESTQRALEQRKVTIGTNYVYAEERRPSKTYRQYDNNNTNNPNNINNTNNNRRFQQNRRGSGGTNAGASPNKRGVTVSGGATGQK